MHQPIAMNGLATAIPCLGKRKFPKLNVVRRNLYSSSILRSPAGAFSCYLQQPFDCTRVPDVRYLIEVKQAPIIVAFYEKTWASLSNPFIPTFPELAFIV